MLLITAREVAGNNLRVLFFSQTIWETCQSLCTFQRETALLQLVPSWVNDSLSTGDESCLADYEIPRCQIPLVLTLKKRISGLLPLIMLLDLGWEKTGKNLQSFLSRFENCHFRFLIIRFELQLLALSIKESQNISDICWKSSSFICRLLPIAINVINEVYWSPPKSQILNNMLVRHAKTLKSFRRLCKIIHDRKILSVYFCQFQNVASTRRRFIRKYWNAQLTLKRTISFMFTIIYLFAVFLFEWDEARGSLSVLTKQIKWDKLICQKRLPRKDRKSVFLTTASRAELIIIEILFKTQG